MNLKDLRKGILTATLGLTGACASVYDTKDACDLLFLPSPLEPGVCRDARAEVIARRAEDRAREAEWARERERSERRGVNVYDSGEGVRTQQIPENIVLSDDRYSPVPGVGEIPNSLKQSIVDEDFKNSTEIFQGKFYFFAANYWKDFDGNGIISPNEYVGIKKRFREGERLMLVSHDMRYGLKGSKVKTDIYSPDGNLIDMIFSYGDISDTSWNIYPNNRGIVHIHGDLGDKYQREDTIDRASFVNFLVEEGGYGNYKAILKLDGKYQGSTEFEIVPSAESGRVVSSE